MSEHRALQSKEKNPDLIASGLVRWFFFLWLDYSCLESRVGILEKMTRTFSSCTLCLLQADYLIWNGICIDLNRMELDSPC